MRVRLYWRAREFWEERASFFQQKNWGGREEVKNILFYFRARIMRASRGEFRSVKNALRFFFLFFFVWNGSSLRQSLLSSFFAQPGAKRITSNPLLKASRRATISIARGLTSRSEMSDPFRVDYRAIDRGFATFRALRRILPA